MSKQSTATESMGNIILDSMLQHEREQLQQHLHYVELKIGEVLYRVREPIEQIYFPTTTLLSWVALTENGDMVEAGIAGYEGIIGSPAVLGDGTSPYQVEVELTGQAYKVNATIFREIFNRSNFFHRLLLNYVHTQLTQLAQSVVCNRFHTVEERLCRWLLIANDRVKSNELQLTQEILAHMIGAHRPAVSIVTGTLQQAGLIRAKRGQISIIDREGLEEAACECYRIVQNEMNRFISSFNNPSTLKQSA